ncbi:CAP domain-containing protein [Sediminibacterium soli]|uniref:CAP domain-containing protein n=1 Tax=Sediminibacterium soli TaxID=2698829 RepID=UPI00137B7527|nr:CAP domain-containing protein [Sediminibacterium soli]NCI46028.1 CAP domain-containing protein [Sediminibacterium soli]
MVLIGLVGMVLLSCGKPTAPSASRTASRAPERPAAASTTNMEASILSYINAYRRSKGLPNLQTSGAAEQQAELHSRNMATGRTSFGHDGFQQRVKNIAAALGFVSASAENVAYGSRTARQVVDGWLNSSGHRRNIEGNYNLTGIGVSADRNGVLYFTQLFVRKG